MLLSEHLRLYLVTDETLSKGRSTKEVVEAAVIGGITCVQLREKHASGRSFLETAQQLRPFLQQQDTLFIINDRIDIALAVDADGVHLGQTDIPLPIARKLLPTKIIGITVHTIEEVIAAEKKWRGLSGHQSYFRYPHKNRYTAWPWHKRASGNSKTYEPSARRYWRHYTSKRIGNSVSRCR